MLKRTSYQVEKAILTSLNEKPRTYADLTRNVDTNPDSIKSHCTKLAAYGFVKVDEIEKHESNGQKAYLVKITDAGKKALHSLK